MVLPGLAKVDAIHELSYCFKQCLKVFIKAQSLAITDVSFNKVMKVALKLEENI